MLASITCYVYLAYVIFERVFMDSAAVLMSSKPFMPKAIRNITVTMDILFPKPTDYEILLAFTT